MADVRQEKPIPFEMQKHYADPLKGPKPMSKQAKYMRTCLKCGENCYSAGEYSEHMQSHGKVVAKSEVDGPRKVQTTMADTGQDVPAEILVKPKRKAKEPSTKVAKSRKKRGPNKKTQEKAEKPADDKAKE
jgi:hypothetical protein